MDSLKLRAREFGLGLGLRFPLHRDPLFWAIVLVFLVMTYFAIGRVASGGTNDFDGFWKGARAILDGEGFYSVKNVWRHLPFYGVVFLPLALVPMSVAVGIWHVVSFFSALVVFYCSFRMLRLGHTASRRTLPIVFLGSCFYLLGHFPLGQVNTVMMGLSMAGLYDVWRGKHLRGGVFIALATAFKIVPGIFIFYLLLKLQWRALAGVVAGGIIVLSLCAVVHGPSQLVPMHLRWYEVSAETAGRAFYERNQPLRQNNHSLMALFGRLFLAGDFDGDTNAGSKSAPYSVNIARMQAPEVANMVRAVQFLFIIGMAVVCLRSREIHLGEVGYAWGVTSLVAPIAWSFYFISTIPAMAVLWVSRERWARAVFWTVAALQLGLASDQLQARGIILFASCLSAVAAGAVAWRQSRPRADSPVGDQ